MSRFWCLLLLVAAACSRPAPGPSPDELARRVTALADAYVAAYFDAFPYQALLSGAPEAHPDQLVDHSLPALERWQRREDVLLAELTQIDVGALGTRPEAVTWKFLRNQLESALAFRVCRMELWNVSPTYTGWQADLTVAAGFQASGTETEQQQALARWSHLAKYLDDEIANLKEGVRLGYTAPRHNVESVIAQVDAMLAAPVAASPFVQMARPDAKAFRASLETLETDTIRPAIRRYRDYLKTTYLPAARTAIGVSTNPDGAACYRAAVKLYATVDMTPEQIRDLGLAQMALLENELREFGTRGFGTSDPLALLKLVREDPTYRFKSRAELIGYAEAAVARAKAAVPQAFGRLPKAPVVIEPYPPHLEKSAPGGQAVPPTADGKPGKYLINAYNPTEQSRAGLESTAFHETYPGHHLQGAIALERAGLHPISRYFYLSGFGEGWGLYSERLADEMNLFSSDLDRIGERSNEALRAARLVVDAGMHALGMTRDQAIDYMLTHTTSTRTFAAAEIDRYIAVPGQATAYMIGNLEIRRLRDQATQALGPKFDLRAFHDLVLEDGTMPLWVLREKVEAWMKTMPGGKRP